MNKPQPKHELVIQAIGHRIIHAYVGSADMARWIDNDFREFGLVIHKPNQYSLYYSLEISPNFDPQEVIDYMVKELGAIILEDK